MTYILRLLYAAINALHLRGFVATKVFKGNNDTQNHDRYNECD